MYYLQDMVWFYLFVLFQDSYAMKASTRNLDYMELLAKVIAAPEFCSFMYYSFKIFRRFRLA